ncbi:MAG: MBL fold metallo-hydrolase [Brevibacillus sp.]|nr:MBL fold metallo-hydrolase [Brevibacillus sp.]
MLKFIEHEGITGVRAAVTRVGINLNVYVFLVDGLLIDTGPSRLKHSLIPFFAERPIRQIVLTHHHEDHTGQAAWLKQSLGITPYIHESGIALCQNRPHLPLYRRLFWGSREPFQPQPLPPLVETERFSFEVIHTPGHADDHVALLNREHGWLFSGDLFVMSHPKSMFAFESAPELIRSLRKVLACDFSTLICSHAGILFDGKKLLRAKLNYLEEISGQVTALYQQGLSIKQIQHRLFPGLHPMHVFSRFENSPYHLVHSIVRELDRT